MGNETSKCYEQRLQLGFFDRYLKGYGIDIGSGADCLRLPNHNPVVSFDKPNGDAQYMVRYDEDTFDFVYSSHCLEHLNNPIKALRSWHRICRPDGYLYVVVPDWTLYEKRKIRSPFSTDHKHMFSMVPIRQSDFQIMQNPKLYYILMLIRYINTPVLMLNPKLIWLNDTNYDYTKPDTEDQTRGDACAHIEMIFQVVK